MAETAMLHTGRMPVLRSGYIIFWTASMASMMLRPV
jgi:hypothetical protein